MGVSPEERLAKDDTQPGSSVDSMAIGKKAARK
jgi:hypothetical protein